MRTFSQRAYNGLIQQLTEEIFLALLTVEMEWRDSNGLKQIDVFRVVAGSAVDVVSNGLTFTPYAFDISLPADSNESAETVSLVIDNTDLMLMEGLRRAVKPLTISLQIVLEATPNTVELELADMECVSVDVDAGNIRATLLINNTWDKKYPSMGETYDPRQCPGLF